MTDKLGLWAINAYMPEFLAWQVGSGIMIR
jgi:hypothetical protein